jgi:hypothetical protein
MRAYLILYLLIIPFLFFLSTTSKALEEKRGVDVVPIIDDKKKPVGIYEESHALVIGIDNYTNGWSHLKNAIKDAYAVAEELKKRGFNVILLKDLTGDELRKEIRQFLVLKGSNPDARLLLWFSGHGHSIDDEGFLVPSDSPLPTSNQFKVTSLHMRDFGGLVRLAKCKHILSIFDSCFAGTIFNARDSDLSVKIQQKTMLPVRQFLTSGDADQRVRDDSSFQKLFLRAIRGEEMSDTNMDGYITGSELGLYLAYRMSKLTNASQTPRYGKILDVKYDRGDFVFVIGADITESLKEQALKQNKIKRMIGRQHQYDKQINEIRPDRLRFKLRSNYIELSVAQIQAMPYISIRKKKKWGFYGYSTIQYEYEEETVGYDKVVIDHTTGLMWHQNGSEKCMAWKKAKQWVKDLNKRGYAGYNDWRVPTAEEATSLLIPKKRNGQYIDPVFEKKQDWIWTGDRKYGSQAAWGVSFNGGYVNWGKNNHKDYIRPVRTIK